MLKILSVVFIFIVSLSCTRLNTLGLKDHNFGQKPANIIWIQLPGFLEEHLAMLRFSYRNAGMKTSFESSACIGKAWDYSLFNLRLPATSGLMSQMTGSKNIKGQCSDYEKKPLWSHLKELGYDSGFLESNVSKSESVSNAKSCEGGNQFLGESIMWSMSKAPQGQETFHHQGKKEFTEKKTYFDKSCQADGCFSSLSDNVKSVWQRFKKKKSQSIFIIREFGYLKSLQKKDLVTAREILDEIEEIYAYFIEESKEKGNIALVLSSAQGIRFEFPKEGRQWARFEKSGRHIKFRKTNLMTSVFSYGAISENFCGIYEQSDVMKRFFWTPQKRKVDVELFGL
jgi:hypothetical protein